MTAPESFHYPGPRRRDWLLLAVNLLMVSCGLMLLSTEPSGAIPCLVFFVPCLAVSVNTILRKRRFARLHVLSVEIVGGTPIRQLRTSFAVMSVMLLAMGLVFLMYWRQWPLILLACIAVMIAAGGGVLVGLMTGYLPTGFMQFDPSGLTIGQRSDAFTLPWDSIGPIAAAEYHDNPVLLLWVRDMNAVSVRPPGARARVIARLLASPQWYGAHVMIMPSQYGIDLPVLVSAVEQYAGEPLARARLAVPRLPPAAASQG